MSGYFSINEISRLTGLAAHTIRFYEKQFPVLLDVQRTRGGHRKYQSHHLEALQAIVKLLKDEKLSIKAAQQALGEPQPSNEPELEEKADRAANVENSELGRALALVLERLDRLCQSNEKRDALLETLINRQSSDEPQHLLEQISRCRNETRETMRMYEALMHLWKN